MVSLPLEQIEEQPALGKSAKRVALSACSEDNVLKLEMVYVE